MASVTGIYRIVVCPIGQPERYYVGQAWDIRERWMQHLRALRAGRHDNIRLQRCFAKYGEAAFRFEQIVACDKAHLTANEQSIVDIYYTQFGDRRLLNVMRQCVQSHLGVKRSAETRERMSLAQKGRPRRPEVIAKMAITMKGRKVSEEAKAKISASHKAIPRHPNSLAALEAGRASPARIAAISAGKLASNYVHSAETKLKIAAALRARAAVRKAGNG